MTGIYVNGEFMRKINQSQLNCLPVKVTIMTKGGQKVKEILIFCWENVNLAKEWLLHK